MNKSLRERERERELKFKEVGGGKRVSCCWTRSVRTERESEQQREKQNVSEPENGREQKMELAVLLLAALALPCTSRAETGGNATVVQDQPGQDIQSDSDGNRPRGDTPDMEEPEPTVAESDYDSNYNYLLSRLAAMDQALHKLNVGHYTLDVKVSQMLDRLLRIEGKVANVEDSVHDVSNYCKDNRKEIGRLEGCVKGRKIGQKCFLVYSVYDTYVGASQKCQERGGRMAMPRDRREQEALADYVKLALPGSNWPVWLGINDLRSEGLYLFDDGTRVTYFQWRKHFLSSQPDGGKRENCVAMSSDDGDWWDNYCDRRMYYLCEFEA